MKQRSYQRGYQAGCKAGRSKGYQDGSFLGYHAGRSRIARPFDGTSIIIPTYNKRDFLAACIDSIFEHTPEPFELIIVDNASKDGTIDYLKTIADKVKFIINDRNLGFAGAVNQGFAAAGGSTLLLLNNDTIVTRHWLSNLLNCVHSSPEIGIVGPVTNYISGGQLIETSYSTIAEMHQFASHYNQSDSSRWIVTGKMTGFCMLMRREVFEQVGYMDEGFEIGNCEDDDFALRTQLAGYELVIAKDTFIHHEGSVSMKALGDDFDQVYGKNLEFYARKWEDPYTLLEEMKKYAQKRTMIDFYPSHVFVQSPGSPVYWIENGQRYLISPQNQPQAVQISRLELSRWPDGGMIAYEEAAAKLQALKQPRDLWIDGGLVKTAEGFIYQMNGSEKRRIISNQTLHSWNLHDRFIQSVPSELLANYSDGIPIIPHPVLKSNNL